LTAFGIFWFFIALSVESSIIPIRDVIFEHRLYLPNVCAIMTMAVAATILLKKISSKNIRMAAIVFIAVFPMVLATATYIRNTVWQSKVNMWADVVEKSPNWWRGHYNLANEYAAAGVNDDALEQYRISIRLAPNVPAPHINMANIFLKRGLYDKAIEEYQIAIRLMPDNARTYYNMGTAYYYKRQYDKAIEHYKTVIKLKPDHADAHNDLGATYFKLGLYELARREFETALRINPNLLEARRALLLLAPSGAGAGGEK
jgi:tetratricopeptide (TPR) repeat protein